MTDVTTITPTTISGSDTWPASNAATSAAPAPAFKAKSINAAEPGRVSAIELAEEVGADRCMAFTVI